MRDAGPDAMNMDTVVAALHAGGVVAYPTEAVYGLGCDPDNAAAVQRLLDLKQRSVDKGLILIAADEAQLECYVDLGDVTMAARVRASWPGPVTWLLPVRPGVPAWLRGAHTTLAVRVTDHPLAAALCRAFGGALVSTSANLSGQPALRDAAAVGAAFGETLDAILVGEVGGRERPSEIRDAATGEVLRPG